MELLELGQQVWEPLTTCSMDIRPTVPQVLWDGDTDLAMQGRIDRREIDRPAVRDVRRGIAPRVTDRLVEKDVRRAKHRPVATRPRVRRR